MHGDELGRATTARPFVSKHDGDGWRWMETGPASIYKRTLSPFISKYTVFIARKERARCVNIRSCYGVRGRDVIAGSYDLKD